MRLVTFRTLSLMVMLGCMAGLGQSASAFPAISVNGSLSDWGISLEETGTDNTIGTDWTSFEPGYTPGATDIDEKTVGAFKYAYHLEDNYDYDQNNGDPVGPDIGGQDYDAEFLGVGLEGGMLKLSVATGQRFDNAGSLAANDWRFSPGDIFFLTTNGTFGLEVGGISDGDADGLIEIGDKGTTYSLGGSGLTKGYVDSDGTAVDAGGSVTLDPAPFGNVAPTPWTTGAITSLVTVTAGTLVKSPTWVIDPFSTLGIRTPVQMLKAAGSTNLGAVSEFVYNLVYDSNLLDGIAGQHAVIEASIDMSMFGENVTILAVGWAPGCGNDILLVNAPDLLTNTPEPTSMLLTGLGALGFIGVRRRQRAKTAA